MKKNTNIIKAVISIIFLFVIVGLYAGIIVISNKAETTNKKLDATANDFRSCNETASKILTINKELTEDSLSFIASGNTKYIESYYDELYGSKQKNVYLDMMRDYAYKYKISGLNYYEAIGATQSLQKIELHAMTLACNAYGIDFKSANKQNVEPYTLTAQELSLTPFEAIKAAGDLYDSAEYNSLYAAASGLWQKNNGIVIGGINEIKNDYSDTESKYLSRQSNIVRATCVVNILIAFFVSMIIVYPLVKRNKDLNNEKEIIKDYDSLTKALNYNAFKEKVVKLFKDHPHRRYVVWYGDIKNFKYVNQTAGFSAGDEILTTLVSTYNSVTKHDDFITRISGDKFAGIIDVENRYSSIFKILRRKYNKFINDNCLGIQSDLYIGGYIAKDMLTVHEMVENAKIAVDLIKGTDKYFEMYTDEIKNAGSRKVDICKVLDSSLQDGSISIYLQPQYDNDRNITGAEALCRWNHKRLGFISPGEFIPILEDENLITKLDKFVWKEACKTLSKWKNNPEYKLVPISINVSRIDIEQIDVVTVLQELCDKYNIERNLLKVEITESAYVDDETNIIIFTSNLIENGFIVEMDDFGSGYSSLNMLKSYPLNVCKLDLKFLNDNSQQEKSQIVISSVIDMVRKLGIEVIAEGVETQEQFNLLKSYGCQFYQGFLFSKPIPVEDFEKLNK